MLCEQVTKMANCLRGDTGEPLLRVSAVCGRQVENLPLLKLHFNSIALSLVILQLFLQGWPVAPPDIIVSTPAALLNYLYAIDPDRRRRTDFLSGVKYVVNCLYFTYLLGCYKIYHTLWYSNYE